MRSLYKVVLREDDRSLPLGCLGIAESEYELLSLKVQKSPRIGGVGGRVHTIVQERQLSDG
jgi:hypothetical protein